MAGVTVALPSKIFYDLVSQLVRRRSRSLAFPIAYRQQLQNQNLSISVAIVEDLKDAPSEVLLIALLLTRKRKISGARFHGRLPPMRGRSIGRVVRDISV
jgi:hypothetical protein